MKNNELDRFIISLNSLANEKAAVLQKVSFPDNRKNFEVFLKREDLIHPYISGNKWRKLKYNLVQAKTEGKEILLTFGGAYSNHIYAVASAGNIFGFKTIGIIRGEEHHPLNPTLEFAKSQGMDIHYIDRSAYRLKTEKHFISDLFRKFGDFYLLPEGGSNNLAVKGCAEIIREINIHYDYILSACGTGGTLAGLICGLEGKKKVIGIPVLKGAGFLYDDIKNHIFNYSGSLFYNWELNLNFHLGGYAKIDKPLMIFIRQFEDLNGIRLDPIYTGKLLYGIHHMIRCGDFKEGSRIVALHTGGLQGNEGMQNYVDKLLS